MKRLFAALKIQPDADFLTMFRKLKQELRSEQIKWVEEQNIHITLKFFGETEERQIPSISTSISKRGSVTPAIDLRLAGIGIFGSSYDPRVIWVGIEPYAALSALMKNLHGDLKVIGFEPDRQNLVPHLTLGRVKSVRDRIIFNRVIAQYKGIASAPMHIGEIILYESILRREGPTYIAQERFQLKEYA
jgi:2'-5' RNA ligase